MSSFHVTFFYNDKISTMLQISLKKKNGMYNYNESKWFGDVKIEIMKVNTAIIKLHKQSKIGTSPPRIINEKIISIIKIPEIWLVALKM